MSRRLYMLVLKLLTIVSYSTEHHTLCSEEHCACKPAAHPSWMTVNCTLLENQNLNILEGDLPESTIDVVVSGAEAVMFNVNSLSGLRDLRRVKVTNSRIVVLRRSAGQNLNIVSAYIEFNSCDVLRIEAKTFTNIKGPLTVNIEDCDYVSLEEEAFSWLVAITIKNVKNLALGERTFTLEHTAANVGKHGPGMTIDFINISTTEISEQTFGSSAAAIRLKSVNLRTIRTASFSANTYNVINMDNCSIDVIESESFKQNSLILNLDFHNCEIHKIKPRAVLSAIANLNISHTRFEHVDTGAINITVASIIISNSEFNIIKGKGLEFGSWNKMKIEKNSFDELANNAIVAPAVGIHELIFNENEIETVQPHSLSFIGKTYEKFKEKVFYNHNYFGQPCHCNISKWILDVLDRNLGQLVLSESYCTVDEFFARCFNVPEQNMIFNEFLDNVCTEDINIKCEPYKTRKDGASTEIKNPRFPHKHRNHERFSEQEIKIIYLVIFIFTTCIICTLFITFTKWLRKKGYCINVKNFLITTSNSCGLLCDRICGRNGTDTARSISQMSVHEYSERHCLNESRIQDITQETMLPGHEDILMEDKTTQTLPEELTKELLESLREKLEDPENYVEAREMIEHLYELIKIEENCNTNVISQQHFDENIYELPYQNTAPRWGKNKKRMISVGTKTPSIENLKPLNPYQRQTALVHEYFEPKDFAIHLYAEIANSDNKDRRPFNSTRPDLVSDQAPRGPYLRAVHEKQNPIFLNCTPQSKVISDSSNNISTIKSNKSISSNSSAKMLNRPLPEKPLKDQNGSSSSRKKT